MSVEGMYVELLAKIEKVADVFDGMDIGNEVFQAFSCNEIEILWDMFDTAGYRDTANQILEWHAEGDDEGDEHYTGGTA